MNFMHSSYAFNAWRFDSPGSHRLITEPVAIWRFFGRQCSKINSDAEKTGTQRKQGRRENRIVTRPNDRGKRRPWRLNGYRFCTQEPREMTSLARDGRAAEACRRPEYSRIERVIVCPANANGEEISPAVGGGY